MLSEYIWKSLEVLQLFEVPHAYSTSTPGPILPTKDPVQVSNTFFLYKYTKTGTLSTKSKSRKIITIPQRGFANLKQIFKPQKRLRVKLKCWSDLGGSSNKNSLRIHPLTSFQQYLPSNEIHIWLFKCNQTLIYTSQLRNVARIAIRYRYSVSRYWNVITAS